MALDAGVRCKPEEGENCEGENREGERKSVGREVGRDGRKENRERGGRTKGLTNVRGETEHYVSFR